MNIGNIVKESALVVRNNLIIIIPPIIVSLFMTIIMIVLSSDSFVSMESMSPEVKNPADAAASMKGLMGVALFIGIVNLLLQVLSQGVIIAMAMEVIDRGTCSLKSGFNIMLSKLNPLMIAAVINGVLFAIGIVLLLLPSLIVSFIFMFTFVIIISEDIGAISAMKKSFALVKENISQTFLIFISLGGIGFLIVLINMVFGQIPFFGQIISAVLMGAFLSFIGVALLKAYRELQKEKVVII